jgi:putative NIF3 family GTP cyclohydrolase 1 type 2
MKTEALAARIDSYFRVAAYPPADFEVAGTMSREQGIPLADYATPAFMSRFNGLMLDNAPEVSVVYTLVFPARDVLADVVQRAAGRPAMVFTHHPMDFETSGRGLVPIGEGDLQMLKDAGISLYSAHAPLDCHDLISTSRALARVAGVKVEGEAGNMNGLFWGVHGRIRPTTLGDFVRKVGSACGVERVDSKEYSGSVEHVLVVAGGATYPELMEGALAIGCDTYLTGDFRVRHSGPWAEEHRPHFDAFVDSVELNLVGASHYATEAVVLESEMLGWFNGLGLPAEFVPQADPWR